MGGCNTKVEAFEPVNLGDRDGDRGGNRHGSSLYTMQEEKEHLFARILAVHKQVDVRRLFDQDGTYSVSNYSVDYMRICMKYGVDGTNKTFEAEVREYFESNQPRRHHRKNTLTM